jgi:hypothetical protein
MRINFHKDKAVVEDSTGTSVIEAIRYPLTDVYIVQEKAPQACSGPKVGLSEPE